MNEIPITSRKYHFAMGMAEKIMEDNAQSCHADLLDVNRVALALSFARTTARLQDSLKRSRIAEEPFGGLPLRVVSALPLGGYVASYVRGLNTCISTVRSLADMTGNLLSRTRKMEFAVVRTGGSQENEFELAVEKLAEELLWMTEKLRRYGAVDEGIKRWSYASGLASLSLTAAPRVQGLMVKISGKYRYSGFLRLLICSFFFDFVKKELFVSWGKRCIINKFYEFRFIRTDYIKFKIHSTIKILLNKFLK